MEFAADISSLSVDGTEMEQAIGQAVNSAVRTHTRGSFRRPGNE